MTLEEYNKEEKRARKVYQDILRKTGDHKRAFDAENKIVTEAQKQYEKEVKITTKSYKSTKKSLENVVVIYGGVPVRYSTVVRHLDKTARATGKENWMAIRDAGLMGFSQFKQPDLPDDVQPLTYEEFEKVTNLPSSERLPEGI